MKKFHFALNSFLEQRHHLENERTASVVSAQTELNNAEASLLVILRSVQGAALEGRMTASDFQTRENLQSHIAQAQTAIAYLRETAVIAQTELQHATRERKIVERLRDHRFKNHRENQIRAEQRDIEESNQCRPCGSTIFSPSSS